MRRFKRVDGFCACRVHRYIYSDGGQLKLWLDLDHSANKESWNRRIIQSQIRVVSPTVVEGYRIITDGQN